MPANKSLQAVVVKPTGHKTLTRRDLLAGLGVAAVLLPVIHSIVAPGPVEAQSPVPTATNTPVPSGSQTFNFTGAEQQFTVPAGVTSVTIQAFGAQGGGNTTTGQGGTIQATIPVTPGEALFVYVGGQGGDGILVPPFGGGAGGFNGGGAGGAGITTLGGGGGASDVRQGGNTPNDRGVVAGGGGGGATGPGWGVVIQMG